MNEGEAEAEVIGNGGGSLRSAGVWADDDCILKSRDLSFNIPLDKRLSVEIIHGNVKETLVSDG